MLNPRTTISYLYCISYFIRRFSNNDWLIFITAKYEIHYLDEQIRTDKYFVFQYFHAVWIVLVLTGNGL